MLSQILFKIGFIQVTYYALVYILGFLVTLYLLKKAAKEKEINMTNEQVYDLIIMLLLGVLVGARIFHIVFWDSTYFLANPIKVFYIWQGGLSFHGGLLGAAISLGIFTKRNKINFWKLADIIVLPVIFFLALGRIANFINQEIVGIKTSVSWCMNFEWKAGCRHPVQLYAATGRFLLFFYLLWITKTKKYRPGFIFWSFFTLIGIGRFSMDFLREGTKYYSLLAGQWLALLMIILGTLVLIKRHKRDLKNIYRNH